MNGEQLDLFASKEEVTLDDVKDFLSEKAGVPVSVVLTKNRVSMLSIAPAKEGISIRMHKAFISAPWDVLHALGRYLRGRRRKDWKIVSDYAGSIVTDDDGPVVPAKLKSKGKVYDLKAVGKSVNDEFFSSRVKFRIGWSRARPERKRRRTRGRYIRFGSWVKQTQTIRIHPVLDDSRVPIEFVRYIVFHEMLHAVVPQVNRNGRQYDHSAEFRKLERAYPGFERMKLISKWIVEEII
ncbi:hypothetical protein BVX97_01250 [bacterium E08(2017)]|nr:hypothetical protein BVX97_01250 [bacterium E08(2017)]